MGIDSRTSTAQLERHDASDKPQALSNSELDSIRLGRSQDRPSEKQPEKLAEGTSALLKNLTEANTATGVDMSIQKVDPGAKQMLEGTKVVSADPVENAQIQRHGMDNTAAGTAKMSPAELTEFKKNTDEFVKRAADVGLSPDETRRTFEQVNRILTDEGQDASSKPMSQQDRNKVAEEVMAQAANPDKVHQGYNNTCEFAALEHKTYMEHPSEAARVVADAVLNQKVMSARGPVALDRDSVSIKQDDPRGSTAEGLERSMASQAFQVAAVNLQLQQVNDAIHAGDLNDPSTHQTLAYVLRPGSLSDTGERIMDMQKNPPEVRHSGDPGEATGLFGSAADNNAMLEQTYRQLTHSNESGFFMSADSNMSQGQFLDRLQTLNREGQQTALVAVNMNNEPFLSEFSGAIGPGGIQRHIVAVTDLGKPSNVGISDSTSRDTRNLNASDVYNDMYLPRLSTKREMQSATSQFHDTLKNNNIDLQSPGGGLALRYFLTQLNPADRNDFVRQYQRQYDYDVRGALPAHDRQALGL